jgi:hypothetical protein
MGGIYLHRIEFTSNLFENSRELDASAFTEDDTDYTLVLPAVEFAGFNFLLDFDGVRILSLDGEDRENVEDIPIVAVNGEAGGSFIQSSEAVIAIGAFFDSTDPDVYSLVIDLQAESDLPIGSTIASIEFSSSQDSFSDDTDTLNIVLGGPTADISVTCFAPGTGIATPEGERAVERLRPGDLVLTTDGRAVPVKWIGRTTRNKLFTPEDRLRPVRITAGALGPGVPYSDLVLTADHALMLDGLLVNAGALVNSTTITVEPIAGLDCSITYYHVETEAHEAIFANGAAAETFVDYATRASFDNGAQLAYNPSKSEMGLPRISSARLVPSRLVAKLAGHIASAA